MESARGASTPEPSQASVEGFQRSAWIPSAALNTDSAPPLAIGAREVASLLVPDVVVHLAASNAVPGPNVPLAKSRTLRRGPSTAGHWTKPWPRASRTSPTVAAGA